MFDKILIANRGEIACRVMRTARSLGIRTVAVYSDADAHAWHVAMADEAFHIGPAAAADSYLRIDRIMDAVRRSGAAAVHPGYGFLSENPAFVEACDAAGVVFIGPPADAIRAMGLKDAAKRLMEEAGVPVVPGYHGDNQDGDFLAGQAEAIGYPVLIKARAGGGGKGMRRVDAAKDFGAALESARREAASSFGDDRVLVEKYVATPRHVEVQVFGDAHGNAVYLFERDCSLQRRHQKVIEEAPAPGMPEDMRRAMGEAAVRAARAVNYTGAGTVEFIADASEGLVADRFYFMEMNTRLQVEHPVTECITSVDLVQWQLRVAAGEPLPLSQDELAIDGHAFEARLYAEDADRGFLPATGTLAHLDLPSTRARVDSGVRAGDTITPFYDPMIAKVIVHGPSRESALNKLTAALADCHVAGCVTNAGFLARLSRHAGFRAGDVDTGLIERDIDALVQPGSAPFEAVVVAALAAGGFATQSKGDDPFETLKGWRHFASARQYVHLSRDGQALELEFASRGDGHVEVSHEGSRVAARVARVDAHRLRATIDGHEIECGAHIDNTSVTLFMNGETWRFDLPDHLAEGDDGGAGEDVVRAPMPGQVIRVAVAAGDAVSAGDALAVMEAMKMEQTLTAPRDGVVDSVDARAGDQVAEGTVLVTLARQDDAT